MNEQEYKAVQERNFLTADEVKALGFRLFFVTSRELIDGEPNVLVHWCIYRPGGCGWSANRFTEDEAKVCDHETQAAIYHRHSCFQTTPSCLVN
jgi:hypothetical protein